MSALNPKADVTRAGLDFIIPPCESAQSALNKRAKKLLAADEVFSARHQIELTCLSFCFAVCFFLFLLHPFQFLRIAGYGVTAFFFFLMFGKIIFLLLDFFHPYASSLRTEAALAGFDPEKAPIYSIIVPLYREEKILPQLKAGLERLDYPVDKKEVFFLLEADDTNTIEKASELLARDNPQNFKLLLVPPSDPRTKPKAMNYALSFITGEYFTIYDAEDTPEPTQLKKAVLSFAALPSDTAALQARLTFRNFSRNWLTKMFTIEYEVWFRQILPGLTRFGFPVPLSGTSTHMRVRDIKRLHGWDSFNVAEDCDLGIRLARHGLRSEMLDSYTLEEAVGKLTPWLKQRSRWIKGYMQSWITHTRRPSRLYGGAGLKGLFSLHFIIGGLALSALLLPPAFLLFAATHLQSVLDVTPIFDTHLVPTLYFLLVSGFITPFLSALLVFARSKEIADIQAYYMLSHVFYWLLAAFSSYKALIELQINPSYWAKTEHGQDLEKEQTRI